MFKGVLSFGADLLKTFILALFTGLILFTSTCLGVELKFNTQDFSPFSYLENGRVSGPAADIIRAVCNRIKVECSFKLMVWKDAQQEVREGKANGMFVIGWNRGRSKWLYFTPQIMQTEYGFFVANGNGLKYQEISDLSGYRVGVYGPSNTSRSLQKIQTRMDKNKALTPIEIDLKPDDVALFRNLNSASRTITAIYSNKDVGNSIIRKNNLSNLTYAGAQKKLNYYIGFSKEYTDKDLVRRFNVAFIQLYQSGEIQQLLNRYSMVSAEIEPSIINYFLAKR